MGDGKHALHHRRPALGLGVVVDADTPVEHVGAFADLGQEPDVGHVDLPLFNSRRQTVGRTTTDDSDRLAGIHQPLDQGSTNRPGAEHDMRRP